MNPVNGYVVIASSNCYAGFIGRKQYKRIAKRLTNMGVPQANILCYKGKHNSSIKFAISSDLTFGECEINQHAATLVVRRRQTGCCILS